MKKDLVEVLSIFDKNKTISEILTALGKDVEITKTTEQINNKEPELVDLGLPSGNLWMTHNMGAIDKTGLGLYYQFGSLVGYQEEEALKHSWITCPFNDEKEYFDEKYFIENRSKWFNNNKLRPEYDIVTRMYGNDYKIPSNKDFKELIDNTTQKYIKGFKGTSVKGMLFTSIFNGKSIFIPFSGCIWKGHSRLIGDCGWLWSNQFESCYPGNAYYFYCYKDPDLTSLEYVRRDFGLPIRGIKVKRD